MFASSLAFSVTIFCSGAVLTILTMMIRRAPIVGGELGGPVAIKYVTSAFLFSLWIMYLVLSSLEVYNIIPGFWCDKAPKVKDNCLIPTTTHLEILLLIMLLISIFNRNMKRLEVDHRRFALPNTFLLSFNSVNEIIVRYLISSNSFANI